MQARDEAIDFAEDAELHGASFPEALGLPPLGLFIAGQRLIGLSSELAFDAGLESLAAWIERHAATPFQVDLEGDPMLSRFAALSFLCDVQSRWHRGGWQRKTAKLRLVERERGGGTCR